MVRDNMIKDEGAEVAVVKYEHPLSQWQKISQYQPTLVCQLKRHLVDQKGESEGYLIRFILHIPSQSQDQKTEKGSVTITHNGRKAQADVRFSGHIKKRQSSQY